MSWYWEYNDQIFFTTFILQQNAYIFEESRIITDPEEIDKLSMKLRENNSFNGILCMVEVSTVFLDSIDIQNKSLNNFAKDSKNDKLIQKASMVSNFSISMNYSLELLNMNKFYLLFHPRTTYRLFEFSREK